MGDGRGDAGMGLALYTDRQVDGREDGKRCLLELVDSWTGGKRWETMVAGAGRHKVILSLFGG